MSVVNLADRLPHEAEYVACISCGHDWVAVYPRGAVGLECPKCHKPEGEPIRVRDFVWFDKYMGAAKNKRDRSRRTMVTLNANMLFEQGILK